MSSPMRNLVVGKRAPLPNFRSSQRWTTENASVTLKPLMVKEYLAQHPKVLDEFILESVSEERIQNLLAKKKEESITKPKSRRPWPMYAEIGIAELCRRIASSADDNTVMRHVFEITEIFASFLKADRFTMYTIEPPGSSLIIFDPRNTKNPKRRAGPIGTQMTVSAQVAFQKESENVRDLPQDSRFPNGVGYQDTEAHFVMCLPILSAVNQPLAVVEFTRQWDNDAFSIQEFDFANVVFSWVTTCVQKIRLNRILEAHSKLNRFLLETTKDMFDDIENIDLLVTKIMAFTKDLVGADRCALFLVDRERRELYADYFDQGLKNESGKSIITKTSQIRFPDDKGIAGYVLKTKETLNITDAYADPRFNPDVDKKTGYKTNNILCMPIVRTDGVIGVVQMVNKLKGDFFTKEDMNTFEMFSVYCAMALHYSRIYNLLAHQQSKFKVAMEVIEFHFRCDEENVKTLLQNPHLKEEEIPVDFDSFSFCCYDYVELLPQLFIKMVVETFGERTFEMNRLCRFILTVRKNYRPVTYHNWEHGFHVAHCLWQVIKYCPNDSFTYLEKIALIVAGICHDLDHRGYNNDFFKKLNLPLADLYSTSVMEKHHYKQTITILHSEGHDIFSFMTAEQHKTVLAIIEKNIIATDLALYFGNQKVLANLIETNTFDITNAEHKERLMALLMTAADLCAVCKPWQFQRKTVDNLYKEFYKQGDEEKERGFQPLPMMDRTHADQIPQQQVGFINFICKPLYSTLYMLLPETKDLLTLCDLNQEHWDMVIIEGKTKQATITRKI